MNINNIAKISLIAAAVGFSGTAFSENVDSKVQSPEQAAEQRAQKTANAAAQSDAAQKADLYVVSSEKKMENWSEQSKDTWAQGKLESAIALNSHLSASKINTEVKEKTATLTGAVNSEVKKELAEEIAMSIEGITDVENELQVNPEQEEQTAQAQDGERDFSTMVSDASLTASVKLSLIGSEVKARDVDVETKNGKVTLRGTVDTEATSDLAEQIAENVDGVEDVSNELQVKDAVAER